ncbi:MAG TPA: TMEM14 family protein [Chthoniobacteraceae bacterium]|jgi:uncharacterized membrane protein (UPF0136 family)|nr:TMEM14 family protein [Chthoniobacteraceae bacterium]
MASIIEYLPVGALIIKSVTKTYYLVFAVLTILGGIMGYVKAKSIASVISGTLSGAILIVASVLLPERPIIAGVIALCVSVLLAGKFVPDFIHKKAFVPGGLMALLSVASIVLTILALLPK